MAFGEAEDLQGWFQGIRAGAPESGADDAERHRGIYRLRFLTTLNGKTGNTMREARQLCAELSSVETGILAVLFALLRDATIQRAAISGWAAGAMVSWT